LVLKFGTVPHWAEEKIAQADDALIDQWFANLLVGNSIEDVFK